jgi:hypothetical protein
LWYMSFHLLLLMGYTDAACECAFWCPTCLPALSSLADYHAYLLLHAATTSRSLPLSTRRQSCTLVCLDSGGGPLCSCTVCSSTWSRGMTCLHLCHHTYEKLNFLLTDLATAARSCKHACHALMKAVHPFARLLWGSGGRGSSQGAE